MSNVYRIDPGSAKLDGPHATGETTCWSCGRTWQAVWPVNPAPKTLECECGKQTYVPPTTDEEALNMAMDRVISAACELESLATHSLSKEGAKQARKWAKGHRTVVRVLEAYIGD